MKRPVEAAVVMPSDRKATEPGQNAAADLALPLPPLPLARARAEAPERLRLQRRRGARRRERSSPRKACAARVRRQRPQNSRLALRGSAKPNSRASSRRGRRGAERGGAAEGSSSLCSLGAPSRVVLTASDEVCRSFGAQVSVAQSCCLGGRRPSCCQGRRKSFQGPGAAGAARPRPRLASAEQEGASQERAWFLAQMITGMYVGLIIGGSCTQTCSLNTLSGTQARTRAHSNTRKRTNAHAHAPKYVHTC